MERVLPNHASSTSPTHKPRSLFDDDFLIHDQHTESVHIENSVRRYPFSNHPSEKNNKKTNWLKRTLWFIFVLILLILLAVSGAAFVYWQQIYKTLPDVNELKSVQMQVPLRIYTSDQKLMAEFGEKRRIPLTYDQFPPQMIQAILAAEDDRFFEHPGVDYQGILRAVFELVRTGHKSQGGSTITMQVARNFFLSPEKSFMRKINEIVLSFKIEHELTKEEILALYMNKIFLGHRSYGFAAAAQTYFGRSIDQLTVDEFAILAGLPKAPSNLNPITNSEAAKNRRDYVLRRMAELNYINEEEKLQAQARPVESKLHNATIEANGDYISEMIRQWALEKFGDTALEQGLNIITTLRSDLQSQAQKAVNMGVLSYERRHGYRGPVAVLSASEQQQWPHIVKDVVQPDDLYLALVTAWDDKNKQATAKLLDGSKITLDSKATEWAKTFKEPQRKSYLQVGDVIYVDKQTDNWRLAQLPKVQAALVSIDSKTGSVLALSGGYDFARNQFNRAVQARRQPGSSFKPFLYAAAIDKGYTPATLINDAPITQYDEFSEDYWRPENYTGKFGGPTRMRTALTHSLNLVSIRILQDIGIDYFLDYLRKLGVETKEMEAIRNLSIALGTASVNVLEHTGHYSIFANGGYKITPYFIAKVIDPKGNVVFEQPVKPMCESDCSDQTSPRVLSPKTHYLITSMMQDVVRTGTATGALVLKRNDLAGKTGTTNDVKDTWFVGFNPDIVTGVWMGFDQPTSLGKRESGGSSALPIWVDYMRLALKEKPDLGLYAKPKGIVTRRIDATTGELLPDGQAGGITEVFDQDNLPASSAPDPLRELQHELF
jgi:penicillin-binding protein 1A